MIEAWLPYFLLTLAIELPVMVALAVLLVGRGASGDKSDDRPEAPRRRVALQALAIGTLVNLFTHPLVTVAWWSWPLPDNTVTATPPVWFFLALEAAVIVAETIGVWFALRCGWRCALLIAGVANVISAAASPVLQTWL